MQLLWTRGTTKHIFCQFFLMLSELHEKKKSYREDESSPIKETSLCQGPNFSNIIKNLCIASATNFHITFERGLNGHNSFIAFSFFELLFSKNIFRVSISIMYC
jgi:hypothetical protein